MGAAIDPRNDTSRRSLRAAAACIVVLVALVHGRTLLGDFGWTFDDARFIVNNPHVTAPQSWTAFFTDMRTTDPLSPTGIVRPLRTLEFALDASLFGLSPTAFRAHTLLWFACGAIGVLLLLREILCDVRSAWVGAALWAMHPMQTEVADWASSRGDAACGALTVFAVWAAVRSRACEPRSARRWLAASLGLGALAVLYKETGVVVPLLVVIAWSAVRSDGRETTVLRRIRDAWPWMAVAAGYLVYRSAVQVGATSHVTAYVPGGSVAGTFATMFRGFGAYLLETVFPARPAVDWYLPASQRLLEPGAIFWLAAHLSLLIFGWTRMRRAQPIGAAVLWFYAALLPVANWPFYLGIPTAERFLHVALFGFVLAVGVAVRRHRALAWPAGLAIACCAVLSFVRAADWRDDTTLWPATAAKVDSPRAHSYLAAELRKDGFARLSAARSVAPGADRQRAEADALRVLAEAATHADTSIKIWQAIEGTADPKTQVLFEPCVNAANIHVLLGQPYVALRYADEAIRIGEDLAPHPHYNRALALLDLGRGEAAVPSLERALELGF
ncbi:MAG: hypothetical protein K8T90_06875, partial [Planctomycetes bacterium]|nr:hypothetical protein [Planctomycetota bacterium]